MEGDGDLLQVDGANITLWERPGRKVEVEGTEIDKEGDVILGLTMVRKRGSNGQVEKEVATREERRNAFKLKYPYLIRFWSDEEIEELME